jgi:hypothetical protein
MLQDRASLNKLELEAVGRSVRDRRRRLIERMGDTCASMREREYARQELVWINSAITKLAGV